MQKAGGQSGVLKASEIYALSQGLKCEGPESCRYCGAACDRKTPHGEPAPLAGVRHTGPPSRNPGGQFMCRGCAAWRRGKITAPYLGGGVKDGQKACWHSWLITPGMAWALKPSSAPQLYERLLTPPCRFFLALIEGDSPPELLLQLCEANDNALIDGTTPLRLTVNNVAHDWSVYELQQAVRQESGLSPGALALLRLFGPPPGELVPRSELGEEVAGVRRGRPPLTSPREKQMREVVRRSGA